MLRFEGDRHYDLPPEDLFARLADMRFLVQCVPDVDAVKDLDEHRASLVLRPGFSFVRGTLEVEMKLMDVVAPSTARVLATSKGIGSSADVEASIAVAPREGGGSTVHWVAEVTRLGNLLKLVPHGLIRGAAEKVVNDAWDRLTQKITQA